MNDSRRDEDKGIVSRFWHWVDERQVDKHVVSLAILYGTIDITTWAKGYAMHYVNVAGAQGADVAMVIAAVAAPYSLVQAAAIKYYFEARSA